MIRSQGRKTSSPLVQLGSQGADLLALAAWCFNDYLGHVERFWILLVRWTRLRDATGPMLQ